MRVACLAALIWAWVVPSAAAFEVEDRVHYPAAQSGSVLRIISTADRDAFEPIILAFQLTHPEVDIDYTITGTTDLMKAIEVEGVMFDLAISSAMDHVLSRLDATRDDLNIVMKKYSLTEDKLALYAELVLYYQVSRYSPAQGFDKMGLTRLSIQHQSEGFHNSG